LNKFERAFDGIGAVADEETLLQIARGQFAEKFRQETAQRVEQFLRRKRHALELRFDGGDDLGVTDAHVVNAKPAQAVDELPAHDVFDDRTLAGPFDGGEILGFGDRFAVMKETAVEVVVKVLQRVGNDPFLVFGIQPLAATDDLKILRRFAQQFRRLRQLDRLGSRGLDCFGMRIDLGFLVHDPVLPAGIR
jgi:hypothetical protein